MNSLSISEARSRFAEVVEQARLSQTPVYITRHQRQVAAVIDADQLERLAEAAEDLADIRAAQAAREEMASGVPAIPWDLVKRDLGLA